MFPSIEQRLFGREMKSWLRPAIIIAVLIGSYTLGRKATLETIFLILAGAAGLVILRAPMLALIPLVIGSFLLPLEIGTGTQSSINIAMIGVAALVGVWVLEMLAKDHRISLFPSRVNLPLLGLCIVAVFSFLVGQLPWFNFANQASIMAQIGGLSLFLLSAGAFLWMANHVTDLKWLRYMVWTYLIIGGFYVLGYALIGDRIGRLFQRPAVGSLMWVWIVVMSSSQAIFNTKLPMRQRILLGLVTFFTLVAGWRNRQWASGWLPGVIGLSVILIFLNWRVGVFLTLIIGISFIFFDPAGTVLDFFQNDQYSLFTRQAAWEIVIKDIVRVSPVLGVGPANYYNYTPLFPILGYSVQFNSHNQYVDLLAQTGFLGLLMFLWLMFEVGWLGWRLKDRAAPGFERAFVIGVLGGVAGTLASGMLGDWVIPFVYNIGLAGFRATVFAWLAMGGLVLIERNTLPKAENI